MDYINAHFILLSGKDIARTAWDGEKYLHCDPVGGEPENGIPQACIELRMTNPLPGDEHEGRLDWDDGEMQLDVNANDWIVVNNEIIENKESAG
jgi:hypothetical protein